MKRLVILQLVLMGCGDATAPEPLTLNTAVQTTADVQFHTVLAETDARNTLHALEDAVRFHQQRFDATSSWTDMEAVAQAHIARARLTSDVSDYLAAEAALDRAFESALPETGPFLTRASYHMVVHQIGRSAEDLDRFESRIWLKDSDKAAVQGLRGDVAFHQGDLQNALIHFEAAEELDPSAASAGRLANFMLKTGRYDEAADLYELAESRVSVTDPGKRAWARLHRGIVELEQDHVDKAASHFLAANQMFTGWYLIEEHIAESRLLSGDAEGAIALYLSVLKRVPNGEFFAALGDAYAELGQDELADEAYDHAVLAFERDIARLPSAASGHALDFYLRHDRSRALELAEANFELRPGHQARTKLAQALLANGQGQRAVAVLEPTTQTEWATVDFLATAALAFRDDNPERADGFARRAEEVIPGIVNELAVELDI